MANKAFCPPVRWAHQLEKRTWEQSAYLEMPSNVTFCQILSNTRAEQPCGGRTATSSNGEHEMSVIRFTEVFRGLGVDQNRPLKLLWELPACAGT